MFVYALKSIPTSHRGETSTYICNPLVYILPARDIYYCTAAEYSSISTVTLDQHRDDYDETRY